ncbi:MAG: DUF7344 domain-containing protein [Halanaeroarchaeum sp.]
MTYTSQLISTDDIFELLADGRRRTIVRHVDDAAGTLTLDAIAESATESAMAHDEWVLAADHRHLPKLETQGVVEYDAADRTITEGPQFDEVATLLTVIGEYRNDVACGRP